jgi:hypothetical protein
MSYDTPSVPKLPSKLPENPPIVEVAKDSNKSNYALNEILMNSSLFNNPKELISVYNGWLENRDINNEISEYDSKEMRIAKMEIAFLYAILSGLADNNIQFDPNNQEQNRIMRLTLRLMLKKYVKDSEFVNREDFSEGKKLQAQENIVNAIDRAVGLAEQHFPEEPVQLKLDRVLQYFEPLMPELQSLGQDLKPTENEVVRVKYNNFVQGEIDKYNQGKQAKS